MGESPDTLTVYRALAERYDQLGEGSMRDRFLILAAETAYREGHEVEAERLRLRLLQYNRHHMLRPYRSYAEASAATDVQTYVRDLLANYPLELAQQLLHSLESRSPRDQTQAVDIPPPLRPARTPSTIPPTAPIVDPYESRQHSPPAWQPTTPYRLVETVESAAIPASEDLETTQPSNVPVQPTSRARMPLRPTMEVPLAPAGLNRRPAIQPIHPMEPVLPEPQAPADTSRGSWLCLVLFGVTTLAALGVVLFTLARPFVPSEWFR